MLGSLREFCFVVIILDLVSSGLGYTMRLVLSLCIVGLVFVSNGALVLSSINVCSAVFGECCCV